MNNLPAKNVPAKNYPKPNRIFYNGHGLTVYRSDNSGYDNSFAVIGSSISKGEPDINAKGRLGRKSVNAVHTMFGALWLMNFLIFFGFTILMTLITGAGFSAAYSIIPLIVQSILATFSSLLIITGNFSGKGYFDQVNSFVARIQLQAEMNALDYLPSNSVKKLHPSVVEILIKLLNMDVSDERGLVSKVTRKLDSDSTDDELYEWVRLAISVFTVKPDIPADFIPELSSDLEILEKRVHAKSNADKVAQAALDLVEHNTKSEINRGFDEIDSTSSLTGALTWLGEDRHDIETLTADRGNSNVDEAGEAHSTLENKTRSINRRGVKTVNEYDVEAYIARKSL